MTGAYLRIQRDGHWCNVEIDQLTDAELMEFCRAMSADRARTWVVFLAGWIRDHVQGTAVQPDNCAEESR